MAETTYNVGKTRLANGSTNLSTSDIRAVIITGSKTGVAEPDLATVAAIDALTSVVVETERVALSSKTVTQDDANNRAVADCATIAFAAAAGKTALGVLFYDHAGGGSDAARFPLGFVDTNFGAGIPMDGGLDVEVPTAYAFVT